MHLQDHTVLFPPESIPLKTLHFFIRPTQFLRLAVHPVVECPFITVIVFRIRFRFLKGVEIVISTELQIEVTVSHAGLPPLFRHRHPVGFVPIGSVEAAYRLIVLGIPRLPRVCFLCPRVRLLVFQRSYFFFRRIIVAIVKVPHNKRRQLGGYGRGLIRCSITGKRLYLHLAIPIGLE